MYRFRVKVPYGDWSPWADWFTTAVAEQRAASEGSAIAAARRLRVPA